MHERQGSMGSLHRPTNSQGRQQNIRQATTNKRSLEEPTFGPFRNMSYTPQYQGRSGHPPQLFRAQPQKALREILSVGSRSRQPIILPKQKISLEEDSALDFEDNRVSDHTARKEHSYANQSTRQLSRQYGSKPTATEERLSRQNQQLRRQNEALKSDLQAARRELAHRQMTHLSSSRTAYEQLRQEKQELERYNDKLGRRYSEMQRECQHSLSQVELYKDIIEKLESRIAVLLEQNSGMEICLNRSIKKLQEFEQLQERLDKLRLEYRELQRVVQKDSEDWELHKGLWLQERSYYTEIIRKLEFQLSLDN